MNKVSVIVLSVILMVSFACSTSYQSDMGVNDQAIEKRPFNPMIGNKWIGNGISYGPYRDGESPGEGSLTSRENILEDLQIIGKRWNLIRMYGADKQSRRVLEVIRDNELPIRVLQGAWLSGHDSESENSAEIQRVIKLAQDFPEIIIAVNVGNEIFVDWSWHRIKDMGPVIGYIREVRAAIRQPVTVCDDYNFWNKPHAAKIANEVDFIGLHAYAFWNNKTIGEAMDWTASIYEDIQSRFPDQLIAYTETGWPTSRVYDDSYEGQLIGKANEKNQKIFFEQYMDWVEKNQVVSLYFEAFDEKWKGGFDGENPMDKAEKHWGVYYSDRQPKLLLQQ